jgi:hypothetical protein
MALKVLSQSKIKSFGEDTRATKTTAASPRNPFQQAWSGMPAGLERQKTRTGKVRVGCAGGAG